MTYIDEILEFEEEKQIKLHRGIRNRLGKVVRSDYQSGKIELENYKFLGIKMRLGNEPIVKNLEKIYEYSNKRPSADLQVLFEKKDIYLIVHAISAIRLSGSAKIDELQYNATVVETKAQTIDLLPNTSFKDIINVNLGFDGSLSGSGNFSTTLSDTLIQSLLSEEITLGADMKIQLSSNANFVGRFSFSLKYPIIQSAGIASNFCTWILNPKERPLLGDQLLIQTIAVPKGTNKIKYKIKGVCKADPGIFWKKQIMETAEYIIDVVL